MTFIVLFFESSSFIQKLVFCYNTSYYFLKSFRFEMEYGNTIHKIIERFPFIIKTFFSVLNPNTEAFNNNNKIFFQQIFYRK